jgi:hypothetical protein
VKLYSVTVLLCFSWSISTFALDSLKSTLLKKQKEIVAAYERKEYLGKEDFSKIKTIKFNHDYAKFYYYAYQGALCFVEASSKKMSYSEKYTLLLDALSNMTIASSGVNKPREFIKKWKIKILSELIKLSFDLHKHYETIKFVEKLSHLGQLEAVCKKYYLKSLYKTRQLTRVKQYVLANKDFSSVFVDNSSLGVLVKRLLDNVDKLNPVGSLVEKTSLKGESFPEFVEQIKANYYDDVFWRRYEFYLKKYLSLKKIGATKAKDKKFVGDFVDSFKLLSPEVLYKVSLGLWKKNLLEDANICCQLFIENFSWHKLLPKIKYYRLRLLEDMNNKDQFVDEISNQLRLNYKSTYNEEAFFRAMVFYTYSDLKRLKNIFTLYKNKYPDGSLVQFISYWQMLVDTNRRDLKNQEEFIKENPISSGASFLVYNNLKLYKFFESIIRDLKKNKKIEYSQEFPVDIREQIKLKTAQDLLYAGYLEDAGSIFKDINGEDSNINFRSWKLSQYRQTKFVSALTIEGIGELKQKSDLVSINDIFPYLYTREISYYLKKYKVRIPAEFILSLIRQESAFDENAYSTAKAKGLMQIIPATAKEIAKSLKRDNFCLTCHDDNINFGIYYISRLLKKYNNNLIYTLCAYNAGPNKTDMWISRWGKHHPLIFINSIPYKETRNYVKLILRNFLIYKILYTKESYSEVYKLSKSIFKDKNLY